MSLRRQSLTLSSEPSVLRHAPLVSRSLASIACALVVWAAHGIAAPRAHAQGADYLLRLLSESDSFRVRVRAATSLGSQTPSDAITQALIGALDDDEDSVIVAAASSLGRVGDSTALAPLRRLGSHSETAVRNAARDAIAAIEGRSGGGSGSSGGGSGGASGGGSGGGGVSSFYVGTGPGSGLTGTTLSAARTFLRTSLDAMTGVDLAPDGESDSEINSALRSRHLTGFYLDWTVTITETDAGLRVRAEIVIQDYPGRNIRSMANSATTMAGDHDPAHASPYIEAVITGALRQVASQLR